MYMMMSWGLFLSQAGLACAVPSEELSLDEMGLEGLV